ncbi:MAG: hypothetical protein GF349_00970 [Candidatus Magasanikbacteria bacterium]|nr:hypothetical protein [Candidatus Magasanikbacteria bacterium]
MSKNINKMRPTPQIMENLGFGEKESKVYLALLELGEAGVLSIAKRAKLKRTTVYPILDNLIHEGLVRKTKKKKKYYYFVEDVNDLKKSLEQKQRAFDLVLPQLKAMHNVIPRKPKIFYYEGLGGMREFYLKILNSLNAGSTIYEFVGAENFDRIIPDEFIKFYPEERVRRKISIKTIASISTASKQWSKYSEKYLRKIKYAKGEDMDFVANMQIYNKGVGIISYKDDFLAVIIESKDIQKMMKSAFNLMWKFLE